ncbi:hypothetical protein CWI37_1898p0010 [Hamiltosporidium tvaerminnensis]|nr:hypothetical protein CWI37_1898p0010 [Hamiltosporidium tvaerminnensis]
MVLLRYRRCMGINSPLKQTDNEKYDDNTEIKNYFFFYYEWLKTAEGPTINENKKSDFEEDSELVKIELQTI